MPGHIEKQVEILNKLLVTENHEQKKSLLNDVIALDVNTPYGLYAVGALAEGDLEVMIHKINEAIKLQPNFPIAHNDLAWAYLSKGDFSSAEKEITIAIKQAPNVPLFYNTLGAVLYHQNLILESKKAYEKAIELSPEFVLPRYNLGLLFYKDLDLDAEAEKEFRESVRLAPSFAAARAFLGLVLLEKENLDDAEEQLQDALQIDPNLWLTHLCLGALYAALGDAVEDKVLYEDALNHLNRGVEQGILLEERFETAFGPIYGLRGYVYGQLGRYKEARADFMNAIKKNPNDIKNKRNLRRLKDALKEKRAPFVISFFTWMLSGASFMAFLDSFWLFHEKAIHEKQFILMSLGFFVLTVVCLYLPHITRFKIGSVELEKVTTKSISATPRFEI